jgi:hypothetical protein
MGKKSEEVVVASLPSDELTEKPHRATRSEREALTDDELEADNVAIDGVLLSASASIERVRAIEPEVRSQAPWWKSPAIDRVENLRLALKHAWLAEQGSVAPRLAIAARRDGAKERLHSLLLAGEAAADQKLINGDAFVEPRQTMGNAGLQELAYAGLTAVRVLRDHWPKLAGRTAISLAQLDAAQRAFNEDLDAVRDRALPAAGRPELVRDRRRAFTLFAREYDELRRIVQFARYHHADVDEITPSLRAQANSGAPRKRTEPDEDSQEALAKQRREDLNNPFVDERK